MSCKYGKNTKGLKYPKYLFAWHERYQILNINSRSSFVEESNVGQNMQFNLCYLLVLLFLYNFHNFMFRILISLILCAFNIF